MEKPLVKFVTIVMPPFYTYVQQGNKTVPVGYVATLLEFLVETMNIRYELIDGGVGYGVEKSPGVWSGALGILSRGEADILLGFYTTIPELFPYIRFSTAVYAADFCVLSGPASKVFQQTSSLFSSVGLEAFLCLIASWIIVSAIYYLFKKEKIWFGYELIEKDSVSDILLSFYGLLFQRGFRNEAKTNGRRFLVTGWLFMTIVFMTMLAATLYSMLAIKDVPERIDKIDDILKYPEIRPYVTKGVVVDAYLQLSENEMLQKVWRRVQSQKGLRDVVEFFQMETMDEIHEGKAVLLTDRKTLLAAMVSHACKAKPRLYYFSKEDYLSQPLVLPYRIGLDPQLVEALSRSAAIYGGMQFVHQVQKISSMHGEPCTVLGYDPPSGKEDALGLREFKEAFQLLSLGLATSCLVLVAERLVAFFKSNKRQIGN